MISLLNYLKTLASSKSRLFLTIIGGVVACVLVLSSFMVYDSLEYNITYNYLKYPDDTVIVQSNTQFQDQDIFELLSLLDRDYNTTFYTEPRTILGELDDTTYISKLFNISGVDGNFLNNSILNSNGKTEEVNGLPIIYSKEWYVGREFTKEDIVNANKVVIINDYGAKLLFGTENPIGKYISFRDFDFDFLVIGVVSNSPQTERDIEEYNKFISQVHDGMIDNPLDLTVSHSPYIDLFIPTTTYNELFGEGAKSLVISKVDDIEELGSNLERYYNREVELGSIHIYNKVYVFEELERVIDEGKFFVYTLLFSLLIVSGISLMNTQFFSVKERVQEIGVRKSVGATNRHILLQFIIEGQLISLISYILALVILLVLKVLVDFYLNFHFIEVIFIRIKFFSILIGFGIISIESFVFSIIPSFYASKIKIVDALNFD